MAACAKYIESELAKGTSKPEIEEYLKKNYREGLWKMQLAAYPEKKNFDRNKALNYTFLVYAGILLILTLVSRILYVYLNPDEWWKLLIPFGWASILLPAGVIWIGRKGLVGVYIMSMVYPLLILTSTYSFYDALLTVPFAIIGYILKKRVHPEWGFIFPKKSTLAKKR